MPAVPVAPPEPARAEPATPHIVPRHTIENIAVADRGGVFIAGWINDSVEELAELRIDAGAWQLTFPAKGLARSGRDDVQAALRHSAPARVRLLGSRRRYARERHGYELHLRNRHEKRRRRAAPSAAAGSFRPDRAAQPRADLSRLVPIPRQSDAGFGGVPRRVHRPADRRSQPAHIECADRTSARRALPQPSAAKQGVHRRVPVRARRVHVPAVRAVLRAPASRTTNSSTSPTARSWPSRCFRKRASAP